MISFRLALEEWVLCYDLDYYAAYCPDIDSVAVVGNAQNQLRCSVIPTNNIRCILPLLINLFRTSKITQLHHIIFRDKKIFTSKYFTKMENFTVWDLDGRFPLSGHSEVHWRFGMRRILPEILGRFSFVWCNARSWIPDYPLHTRK